MLPAMDTVGVEPALLAKFILACQAPTLSETAAALSQTPSALGIALHGLERRLGMQLFIRHGGGLSLRPSAFWLFQSACRLLYLEQHIGQARHLAGAKLCRLEVKLDLSFAIGRFSKALIRTAQQFIATQPDLIVTWRFAGALDEDDKQEAGPDVPAKRAGRIKIGYGLAGRQWPVDAVELHKDPWIVVGAPGSDVARTMGGDTLYALGMRERLREAIRDHAMRGGWSDRLRFIDNDPVEMGNILSQLPHQRLVMPASLLASRMGLVRHEHASLEPELVSPLLGVASGGLQERAEQFLQALRDNFGREERVAFTPGLTARQVHYFNLAVRTGGISAAARVANVAQSSVSTNLTQMETVLGETLLERHEDGVRLSARGAGILPFITSIEDGQDWIARKSRDIAAHAEARVTIGTLPSSGHDSALTEKIARVVTRIHANHPAWQLQIIENTNAVLHDLVRSGDLNLAVVGVVSPQVARIPLGPSEPLCVICHPSIYLGARHSISLEEVCALPLVLGRRQLSIHQSFAEAAARQNLHPKPVIEAGSLALAIAMVTQARLCTILPASSVRQDIEQGSLVAVPISQEELSGALSLIFSAERELSEAERIIVQEFVRVFRPDQGA